MQYRLVIFQMIIKIFLVTLICTAYASFVRPHLYSITFFEKASAMLLIIVLLKVSSMDDDIYHKIKRITVRPCSTNASFFK